MTSSTVTPRATSRRAFGATLLTTLGIQTGVALPAQAEPIACKQWSRRIPNHITWSSGGSCFASGMIMRGRRHARTRGHPARWSSSRASEAYFFRADGG